ncbi:TIGR03016 family PEP-CTERM system-associated outer membrane protein [Undibacterium sp.]|uniref:TIGR03016 family PEP-CTERM system-associated outer membrane protein n=1 Tax=Undibacterium sp. TaxID=1914977 RepID=UPI002BFDE034|nr:TIGR03016 family PEP-CTERM system-associated outer membrane protein [Undibacterium sp.]HTD04333.1 TIGR03016 family PEP-CTERM system-associated outer membrane protein [Undibacterium sp.]
MRSKPARGRHRVRALSYWVAATLPPLAMTLAAGAHAAEWKITPTVNLTETYTDNVRLAPDNQKQSSFITAVSPGVDFSAVGAQARMRVSYQMQNLYYTRDANGITTNHLLNADGNTALVKDLFFLDGSASITQQNQNPFGPEANNNLNLSSNRTEVRTYRASPYFKHAFDNQASAELRYTHDSVTSSTGGLNDSTGDQVSLSVASGTAFQKVKWGFHYDDQKSTFKDAFNSLESQTGGLDLSYNLSSRFALTASSGYEKNSYISLDGKKPQGAYWSAGFNWSPSERTNLAFSTGRRFYGQTFSLTGTQRTRATAWALGYHEDLTTTRQQFLVPGSVNTSTFLNQLWQTSIPDPIVRQQLIDSFIRSNGLPSSLAQPINTFSNQVFLQKMLQGSVAVTGAQNTVVFSLYNSRREAQSAAIGPTDPSNLNSLGDVKQTGASVLWNLVFSPRTSANFSLGYDRADASSTGERDYNKLFRAAITRDLQPKLKATLEYRHNQKDSNIGVNDFRENALTLSFLLRI